MQSPENKLFVIPPEENLICNCNQVSEAEIRTTIRLKNLNSISQIIENTSASSSCGRCRRILRLILEQELRERKQD